MEQVFLSKLNINKVRHLSGIEIPLSNTERKHLILTGENGSGKTSLLDAISRFLDSITSRKTLISEKRSLELDQNSLPRMSPDSETYRNAVARIASHKKKLEEASGGVTLELNQSLSTVYELFQKGEFIVAYYKANRTFDAMKPTHVEKVELKDTYSIQDTPRTEFIKYLLDMKVTESLSITNGNRERADWIHQWFESFQSLLTKIYGDKTLRLEFDVDTFRFFLVVEGREPFDFYTLSDGYAAILDIVADLILRMDKHAERVFDFSMPGIVLIDEIETHLHLELQKRILPFLTTTFPNVQFIVSTHSPFVLNSLENVTIYDLQNQTLVENGLADVPYGGIVEGYFNADELSDKLRAKYERYKELAAQPTLSDEDLDELSGLEIYLDEIPDYLALDITTEYRRLKQELRARGTT